jgi:hypothetical protein
MEGGARRGKRTRESKGAVKQVWEGGHSEEIVEEVEEREGKE